MRKPSGRPSGKGPTQFWTAEERELVRKTMGQLQRDMSRHTERAIISMMLRIYSGEFDD